jgi:hypothetical protein
MVSTEQDEWINIHVWIGFTFLCHLKQQEVSADVFHRGKDAGTNKQTARLDPYVAG